jgi:hypothetical protein
MPRIVMLQRISFWSPKWRCSTAGAIIDHMRGAQKDLIRKKRKFWLAYSLQRGSKSCSCEERKNEREIEKISWKFEHPHRWNSCRKKKLAQIIFLYALLFARFMLSLCHPPYIAAGSEWHRSSILPSGVALVMKWGAWALLAEIGETDTGVGRPVDSARQRGEAWRLTRHVRETSV